MYSQKGIRCTVAVLALFFAAFSGSSSAAASPQDAGSAQAVATQAGNSFQIENPIIGAKWSVADGAISGLVVMDRLNGTEIKVQAPFAILLQNGAIYDPANLKLIGQPVQRELTPLPDASRLADRLHGAVFDFPLESSDHSLKVVWSVVLLDGSTYLRQILTLTAVAQDVPISRVELIDLHLPGAQVSGTVAGSPIVAGNLFLGFEHPLSESKVTGDRATAWINRDLPLHAGQSITYSSVIGVAHPRQMRRDFLAYLNANARILTAPSCTTTPGMTSDISIATTEQGALDRVRRFRRGADEKRGVKLDQLPLRRWLGRSTSRSGSSIPGFPMASLTVSADRRQVRRCAWRLAVPMGRIRQTERGAHRLRPSAGIRDHRRRTRLVRAQILSLLSAMSAWT